MATLLYSAAASLDGFIAGPGGDMQWLARFMGGPPDEAAAALPKKVGALLVGRRTWEGDDPNRGDEEKEGAFGGTWHGPQFVVTHEPPADSPDPDVHFDDDLAHAIAAARAAAGKGYVCVLGAELARGCLELGEVDEVLVFFEPIMLGDGVRLFDHSGGAEVELERIGVEVEPTATHLWFRVVR